MFAVLGKGFQFLPVNYGFNFFNFSADTPYQIEVVSFYPYFAENFYHEWVLDCAKCFIWIY